MVRAMHARVFVSPRTATTKGSQGPKSAVESIERRCQRRPTPIFQKVRMTTRGTRPCRLPLTLALGLVGCLVGCGHMNEGSAPRAIRSPERAERRVPQRHGEVAQA